MATAQVEERQLLKAMSWWDGFVIALANPVFLIAALGASIGVLGKTGAFVLWTISVCIGALQNNVYAEMATMFPNKAGGVIGTLAQAEWFSSTTFTQDVGSFQWSLPVYIGIGCILAVWLVNIFGVRPAVWVGYVTGALLLLALGATYERRLQQAREAVAWVAQMR